MWLRHWHLVRDPFCGPQSQYVPTSGHEEAIARLVAAIEASERSAALRSEAGLGKTVVLNQAIASTRHPGRKFARVTAPIDGDALIAGLAAGLGRAVAPKAGRSEAWRTLVDALRLCRWQKLHAVLVVDDVHCLADRDDRRALEHLARIDAHPQSQVTVVCVGREGADPSALADGWRTRVRLPALLRSETERYVIEKLGAAGRSEPTFTPRAFACLHALTAGVPRGIDRLASLALMAGAGRGIEVVTPEVLRDVAHECERDGDDLAA